MSTVRFGRTVGERHTFLQRGVGVDHGGRNVFVIGAHAFFEGRHRLMHRPSFDEGLGRATPDHDQALGAAGLLEVADVVAQLLGQLHLVLALFHVGTVEPLHVILVEDSFARLDLGEKGLDLVQQRDLEHARVARGGIHVVFEDVPSGEDQVVQPGEWNEFVDLRRASLGALAEADGAHLGERADGR